MGLYSRSAMAATFDMQFSQFSNSNRTVHIPAGFKLILGGVFRDPALLSCEKLSWLTPKNIITIGFKCGQQHGCLYFITQLHDLHELRAKNMNNYLPVHAITDALAVKYAVKPADIAFILISTYIIT